MIGQVGKDIHNAQQRILDHRVFVCGEIENILNNFELKRNEAEVETLFKVTESTGELKYELCERCDTLATAHLTEISNSVKELLGGIENFLTKAKGEKVPSDSLVQARQQRSQKKTDFCKELEHRYQRLDNSFEEKEEEIAELYSDLQLKLNIPK